MVSLYTVCKHTLGMKAWKAFYNRITKEEAASVEKFIAEVDQPRCDTRPLEGLDAMLLVGTSVQPMEATEQTLELVLLASEPLPEANKAKKKGAALNKLGGRCSHPKLFNTPTRTDDLKELEAQANEVLHANTNKKEMKQGMQAPIITVMEHTG